MSPPSSGASPAAPRQQQTDPSRGSKQPLSCANCRHRKIKCDKVHPRCSQCERSDLDCVFPSRKRNRKPRQGRQSELLNRITRLESIVGKVDSGGLHGRGGGTKGIATTAAAAAAGQVTAMAAADDRGGRSSCIGMGDAEPFSATVLGRSAPPPTNYLSAEFWENLCQEVEGMRQALDQPSDDEESSDEEPPQTTSPGSSANNNNTNTNSMDQTPPALSGLISSGYSVGVGSRGSPGAEDVLKHPPGDHILYMSRVFFANVDPAFKVLHRPTTSAELEAFANSPSPRRLDVATEALFFAMYFGAVTSLTSESCLQYLGEERSVLAQRYKEGVERALYKADYLNSTEIKTLQALTFYVCFLRSHNASRASWALIPLVVRLAQALQLHRDGISPPFPPFEAELRRRLWWMIVVLDIRAAEDRGTDAAIPRQSYNTRLPFNLDDDDFCPSTIASLEDRTGPTEMTFCLCTSMSSGIFGNLRPRHPQLALDVDGSPEATTSEDEIMAHAQRLETLFGTAPTPPPATTPATTPASSIAIASSSGGGDQSCNDIDKNDAEAQQGALKHLPANHAAVTVRIIILKMWLSAQYPFTPRAATSAAKPRVARETMLRTAINTIELVELSSNTYRARFGWWIDSYVQWHPLAVALAELCVQTHGELADRAWRVVDRNFREMGDRIADTRRGTLWRPLKKLLRKARAARAEALMRDLKVSPSAEGGSGGGESGGGGGARAAAAAAAAVAQKTGDSGRQAPVTEKEEEEDEEDGEGDADVDVDFDFDVAGNGYGDVVLGGAGGFESRHLQMPNVLPTQIPPIGVGVGSAHSAGAGAGLGGPSSSMTMPDAPPNPFAAPDTSTFRDAPLWGHPQDLMNHFGLQMDAGDFSWDWSTWNEFVDDANTERSPDDR